MTPMQALSFKRDASNHWQYVMGTHPWSLTSGIGPRLALILARAAHSYAKQVGLRKTRTGDRFY